MTKKRKKRQNVRRQNDKRKALNDEIKNGNIKRQNKNKTKRQKTTNLRQNDKRDEILLRSAANEFAADSFLRTNKRAPRRSLILPRVNEDGCRPRHLHGE